MAAKTGTYTLIASNTLGSAASSVTFNSIPGTYTDLVLVVAGSCSSNVTITMRYNSDTSSNYSVTYINGDGSSATSGRQTSLSNLLTGELYTYQSNQIIQIQDYSNTTTYKTMLTRANTPSTSGYVQALVGLWRSTSAITRIDLIPGSGANFTSGSTFKLYGIEAGNL